VKLERAHIPGLCLYELTSFSMVWQFPLASTQHPSLGVITTWYLLCEAWFHSSPSVGDPLTLWLLFNSVSIYKSVHKSC
jgi:hypothetical protein